jgi:drug/metabolite transporter (DMT)-like permease
MIGSATLSGIALSIQRLTLTSVADISIQEIRTTRGKVLLPILENPWWRLSLLIAIGAWLLNVQALKDADLSLVKPLVNLNVIVVILITYLVKREQLTFWEYVGVVITILGAILLGLQTVSKEDDFEMSTMTIFSFLIILFCLGACAAALQMQKDKNIPLAICSGLIYGLIAALTNAVVIIEQPTLTRPLSFLDLLLSPGFWLILILTLFAFSFMQAALALGKGGIATAISDGLSISVATISAIIVFTEVVDMFRVFGIVLVTGGAIILHQLSEQDTTPQ